jgi:ferric-dicitrate binding protein FerR (iron transport regulator)
MRVSILRKSLCWLMLALMPHCLLAQDIPTQPRIGGAILRTQGGVWVNGYEAQDSSAVFPGDLIETKVGFSASLTLDGSTVLLGPQSLVKFGDNFLVLEHGGVSVGTSRKFEVRVNCMRVVPVLADWTQYEVQDVNRTMQVSARKDDVNVEREGGRAKGTPTAGAAEQHASVHEGEQRSYDENEICGAPPAPTQAGAINAKWIEIGGGVAGAGVLCALLCRGGGGPSKPNLSQSAP